MLGVAAERWGALTPGRGRPRGELLTWPKDCGAVGVWLLAGGLGSGIFGKTAEGLSQLTGAGCGIVGELCCLYLTFALSYLHFNTVVI